jgi:gliding motility-associated transport system ATP-binding protein
MSAGEPGARWRLGTCRGETCFARAPRTSYFSDKGNERPADGGGAGIEGGRTVIEARGLSMRYGAVHALQEATFDAAPGEVVGLLGPNGAGKSTTMRILTTFQQPSGGTARVAGLDVVEEPLEVRRRIGYLPESLPLYLSMEVRDCLAFVGRARGLGGSELKQRIGWVVEKCGLSRMYHTPCLELSKGFRQRTALAQALLHDPEVVVLDEPTTGLDPHQILEIRALVSDLASDKTVVLSTHIMQEADALADRLLVMSRGRIVGAGTSDELRRQAGVETIVSVTLTGVDEAGRVRFAEAFGDAVESLETPAEGTLSATLVETEPGLPGRVGTLAHEQGWTVTDLHHDKGSLEDVFLNLTRDDWAPHEAPPPEPPDESPDEPAPESDDDDGVTEVAA